MRLNGKVTIITGAASGIGRSTALLFAREGAQVIVADRNEDAARATAGEIGANALPFGADVSKSDQVAALVETSLQRYGRIDVLVNNAGYGFAGTVVDTEESDWDALMSVNLKGVFLCCKHVVPVMARQGGGTIVNIGSYTASVAIAGRAAYVASKGGVISLTRAMALDHIGEGVRINAVAPGTISSPYFDKMLADSPDPAALRHSLDARSPLGRMGRPEEIAEAALWLASDASQFAVGSVLTVDGGTTIW